MKIKNHDGFPAIIDSQTAKGAQKRGAWLDPSGYDVGQEDQRSQAVDPGRHAVPPVERRCSPCGCSGPRRGFQLLRRARRLFPFIKHIFADGGYAGEKMALAVWRTGHGGYKS
jgi:putative transposase